MGTTTARRLAALQPDRTGGTHRARRWTVLFVVMVGSLFF